MSPSEVQDLVLSFQKFTVCATSGTSRGRGIRFPRQQASSLNTEFLGESRIALRYVLESVGSAFSGSEKSDVEDVVLYLNTALDGPRL